VLFGKIKKHLYYLFFDGHDFDKGLDIFQVIISKIENLGRHGNDSVLFHTKFMIFSSHFLLSYQRVIPTLPQLFLVSSLGLSFTSTLAYLFLALPFIPKVVRQCLLLATHIFTWKEFQLMFGTNSKVFCMCM